MDKLNRTYNMDESGMPLDNRQLKCIASKGPWAILREEDTDHEEQWPRESVPPVGGEVWGFD